MKKSIVAMAVCIVMTLMLLPTTVFAEGEASLQIGTTAIKKGDIVYYGTCAKEMKGYKQGDAIQWQVLDAENDNTGNQGMFLLSKYLLEDIQFDAVWGRLEDGRTNYNDWQHSDAQDWCKSFVTSSFAAGERTGIKTVSKTDDAEELYDVDWAASKLDQEQVFLLSAREVHDYLSKYDNVAKLEATYKNENSGSWWLRSPYADSQYGDEAGFVAPNGIVWGNRWAGAWYAARPAFNLDIDSILFSSAAQGGKSSGTVGAEALQEIASNDTSEWKLTIKDSSRDSFSANTNSETTQNDDYEDWSVEIGYNNAKTGSNEYISALLCDEAGNALYYGNIAKNSASGTAGVKIPSGLSVGTYTLNVFSEQCNGDYMTDYASAFQEITLTVEHEHAFDQKVVTPKALKSGNPCTENAEYYMSCVCGEVNKADNVETFTSDPLGHDWSEPEWVWTKESEGFSATATAKCSRDGATEDATVTAAKKETTPTCAVAGEIYYEVTVKFGEKEYTGKRSIESISPTGNHTLGKWEAEKPATCTEIGIVGHYTCEVCNKYFDENEIEIAKRNMILKPTGDHTFGEWEITKEATETANGEKHRICDVCGYEETAEIPMLSSGGSETEDPAGGTGAMIGIGNPAAGNTAATNGNDQTAVNTDANAEEPETGDESNMLFFIILAGLSAAGCATVMIRRRADFGSGRKTER